MSDPGWGATSYGGASSDVLLEVEVPVVTKEQCITAMAYLLDYFNGTITLEDLATDGMICAGGVEGKGSCQVSAGHSFIVSELNLIFLTGRLRRSSDLQERDSACSHRRCQFW